MLPATATAAVDVATFEVMIESPGAGTGALRLMIEADNWVEAWREGLRVMGDPAAPADAVCVLRADKSVHVTVSSTPRIFTVREQTPVAVAPPAADPAPAAGRSTLVRERTAAIRVHDPIARAAIPRQPLPRSPLPRAAPLAPPAARPQALDDAPANQQAVVDRATAQSVDTDPVVRVLTDLERQRLSARPIRISSKTGLPLALQAAMPRKPRNEATRVGRGVPTGPQVPERPAVTASMASKVATSAGTGGLPQQFRAITASSEAGAGAGALKMTLDKAVDTAWQHVPCQLVAILRSRADGLLEVASARGVGEREALGCRLSAEEATSQVLRGPGRAKFPEASRSLRFIATDAPGLEVPVRSSMCVPIETRDGGVGLLLLVNAARATGFDDAELRAVSYLAKTLARSA